MGIADRLSMLIIVCARILFFKGIKHLECLGIAGTDNALGIVEVEYAKAVHGYVYRYVGRCEFCISTVLR